jgi:glycosyltransferase involved in cell wall biosynthesis
MATARVLETSSPRVSVLMIFLDAESFIEEAINSVCAQTYESWELLLIDDGSTDGSAEVAREYAAAHPARIRYLTHPGRTNRGMSASRNLGLSHARGDLIALLDADDRYLPNKLAEQVALLDSMPEVAMLYGRTRYWFSWPGSGDDRPDSLTETAPRFNTVVRPPEPLEWYLRHEIYFPCTCSVLIRREALDAVGGFEDAFRGTYEDMAFYSKLFLRYPVYISDRCWDLYRQHPASCWAVATQVGEYREGWAGPARLRFLRWLNNHIKQAEVRAPTIRRILRRKLLFYRSVDLLARVRRAVIRTATTGPGAGA